MCCGLYSGISIFCSQNAQLERRLPVPELSSQYRAPMPSLLERNRVQVDGVSEKTFQNGTGHVLPPCPPPEPVFIFV